MLLTGNAGILSESAKTLGLLNAAAASTAGAVSSVVGGVVNVSADAGTAVKELVSTSAGLVKTFYNGVDVANVTLRRRHGRLMTASPDGVLHWLSGINDTVLAAQARDAFLLSVVNVSWDVPHIEASDFWLDAVNGHFIHWEYKCRLGRNGFVGFVFVVSSATFTPRWANPYWEMMEVEMDWVAQDIAKSLFKILRALEPLPTEVLRLDDSVLALPWSPSALWRRKWVWAIAGFFGLLALWRIFQVALCWHSYVDLETAPPAGTDTSVLDNSVEENTGSSMDGFQLIDSFEP